MANTNRSLFLVANQGLVGRIDRKAGKPKMAFWWVNHKQTHKEEIEGGLIWSPKENKDGSRNQTYLNLTRVSVGDTVFSYAYGEVKAVGIVKDRYKVSQRPSAFGKTGEQWLRDGWMVPIEWTRLNAPIAPKLHLDDIRPLLPKVNSPLRGDGNGNQGCYLAEIDEPLARLLLQLVQAENTLPLEALEEAHDAIQAHQEEEKISKAAIPETEKEQLIKARYGQGIFRTRVEAIESRCRLTNNADKRFLIASHIKPWKLSDNSERLDGNNGLLLSPHVDKLFDKGWISFSDDGKVLCEDEGIKRLMTLWGLDSSHNCGVFNENQCQYLAFHRANIYKTKRD